MLRDRYHLSSEEITAVHDDIRRHEQVVTSIDVKLETLAREASLLRVDKIRHLELISKCRGVLTLARLAPDEVLSQIFEDCVAENWARAPLVVSQVCAKWRRAALSPRVWAKVLLTSDSLYPIGRTRLWLSKALQSPLHIVVDIAVLDSQLLTAMDLLLNQLQQWYEFTLHSRFMHQACDILARCARSAPNLRSVSISISATPLPPGEGSDGMPNLRFIFQNAPQLKSITWTSNTFPSSLPSQISELTITLLPFPSGPMSVLWLLEVLANLPSLKNLTLTIPVTFSEVILFPREQTPPFLLSRLESLTVQSYPDFNNILLYIQTPNLSRLHLRSSEPPLNHPHAATGASLCRFIESVSPPLELLELYDVDLPRGDFIRCFLGLSTLQELRLHETEISDDVFALIAELDGPCPQLRRLDLRWCEQLSGSCLVNLISARNVACDIAHSNLALRRIEEITLVNCALVKERDVLDLAKATVCSVIARNPDDYCRK